MVTSWVIGSAIRELRERASMTQAELACRVGVSDKAVSKWETGRGYPDITLIESLARELGVSTAELLAGAAVNNTNVSANMLRSALYVCPVCGNVVVATGDAHVSCHGITLPSLAAEPAEQDHALEISIVEDELYVRCNHPMSKAHHLTFLAAASPDRVQIVRLYPEGPAEARFMRAGVLDVYAYCNRDGLFAARVSARVGRNQQSSKHWIRSIGQNAVESAQNMHSSRQH